MGHPILSYCKRHKTPLRGFAARLGVNPSTIYRLVRPCRGHFRRPSAELMIRIENLTAGEVGVRDLMAAHFGPIGPNLNEQASPGKGEEDHAAFGDAA